MADYSALKATIDANINTNGNQEITGAILNEVLNEMVDTLGSDTLDGFIQVVQDGLFFVDSAMNIGVYVDANGIHADNILEYQIVNL